MEGREEFLVRWEFGAGMVSRGKLRHAVIRTSAQYLMCRAQRTDKLPLDRSWVAGELLGSVNECAQLITEFFNEKSRRKTIGEETSIHFNSMRNPQTALARWNKRICSVAHPLLLISL